MNVDQRLRKIEPHPRKLEYVSHEVYEILKNFHKRIEELEDTVSGLKRITSKLKTIR